MCHFDFYHFRFCSPAPSAFPSAPPTAAAAKSSRIRPAFPLGFSSGKPRSLVRGRVGSLPLHSPSGPPGSPGKRNEVFEILAGDEGGFGQKPIRDGISTALPLAFRGLGASAEPSNEVVRRDLPLGRRRSSFVKL